MSSTFADAFEDLCTEVILPTLKRIQFEYVRRGGVLQLAVVDGPGPNVPNPAEYFPNNRRVILQLSPIAELWFVGWEPTVLVQDRRLGAGPLSAHSPEEVTSAFVENTALQFLSSLTNHNQ